MKKTTCYCDICQKDMTKDYCYGTIKVVKPKGTISFEGKCIVNAGHFDEYTRTVQCGKYEVCEDCYEKALLLMFKSRRDRKIG